MSSQTKSKINLNEVDNSVNEDVHVKSLKQVNITKLTSIEK